jgi:Tol biopolymer transport system component
MGYSDSGFILPSLRDEEGEIHMARRTLYLQALLGTLAAAVLVACAVALLVVSEKAEATFPGKSGRIAYSGYDGNDYEIYTVNSRGGNKFQVTNNNTDDYSPSYSPNGKRIAYVELDRNDAEIHTINAEGRGKTQLTHNNKSDTYPSYSPDGKKIAYTVSKGSSGEDIYTINSSGGGKTQFTHNNADESSPSWGSRP